MEEKHIIYKPCGKCGRKQNRRQLLCVHCLGTDMTREIMVGEKVTHSSDGTRIMTDEEVDDFLKPMVGESVRDLVQGSRQKTFKGMKGYLEKRGEGAAVDTWNKRWVMAGDNGRLQYYEDEMDLINGKQPLQTVDIKKVKVHDFHRPELFHPWLMIGDCWVPAQNIGRFKERGPESEKENPGR